MLNSIEYFHAVPATHLALGNAKLFVGNPEPGLAMGALCLQAALSHAYYVPERDGTTKDGV
jgi:hypothetical protein